MAGWSIAQNPLLLPGDQPCNVQGTFCKGLIYCQQGNLSAFTERPRKVTLASEELSLQTTATLSHKVVGHLKKRSHWILRKKM